MADAPSCATCRYWSNRHSGGEGACRRFPPTPVFNSNMGVLRVEHYRPTTHKNAWCGEFEEKAA